MNDAYQKLKNHFRTVHMLHNANALIGWDLEVMMPPHAADEHAEIMATLSAVAHEKATASIVGEWLQQAEVSDEWDVRNLSLLKQNYALASQVPEKLVFALEESRNKTSTIWQEAKASSDWKKVEPHLADLFALQKEQATIYADVLGCPAYDAMLFQYARGNTQEKIDPLFAQLRRELPPIVQDIAEAQKDITFKQFKLDVEKQKTIARDLAQQIGFSFDRGRLDIAAHPFSGGTSDDSRITTRYSEEDGLSGFYGVIHEVGHALYSQSTPKEWAGQPVGADSDLSLHESQSLITEKQAGLNDGFVRFMYDFIVQRAPEFAQQGSVEDFKNTLYRVRPSFIRVDADEATYPLHIVLRYELEKKLFSGEAAVSDIPELWNDGFKELFGMDVPEHKLGCMQDVHWYWGMFGYFPTYTQGALYAAQLFDAMKRDVAHVENSLVKGDLTPFNGWLKESVRRWGQRFDAPELIERATGHAPDASYFLSHLKKRYLGA